MAADKNIYLIGKDLKKSNSKIIQDSLYGYLGINFEYVRKDLGSEHKVSDFIKSQLLYNFFASNVTYPYKNFVYKHLEQQNWQLSESVKFANGCNLIIAANRSMYNFDGQACSISLKFNKVSINNKNILICGTGVTAMSICFALQQEKPNKITIMSRSKDKVNKLKKSYKNIEFDIYQNLKTYISDCDIFIDATPLSYNDLPIFDVSKLNKNTVVFDVRYGDFDTPIIANAKNNKLKAIDGKGMLIAQAVLSVMQICNEYKLDIKKPLDFKNMYNVCAEKLNLRVI